MAISGVGQNYYQNNAATTKNTKNVSGMEKTNSFAGKIAEKGSVSPEDMTLEEYKEYFNEKMNSLYTHPSQRNMNDVIDITDAAYKRMQTDPEYEKKILDALAKNKAVNFGAYIPVIAYTRIDDTWEKCYGYTRGMKENVGCIGGFSAKGGNDAVRQKKARQKELLEEHLEKRAQAKIQQKELLDERIVKAEQEKSRLARAWNSERQMAKAANAYDANVTMAVRGDISEEGRSILREMVSKFEPDLDYIHARELTIQNTNEVAWEHYTAMRGISSQTLKDGNYNVDDVIKSIMDTYEARYNEIVKEHERGDREVSYGLTGKNSLTLEEDLAGLEEAFKMRLANLEGYITCQQTNKAFENPDSLWYFNRNGLQNEGKTQDRDVLKFRK